MLIRKLPALRSEPLLKCLCFACCSLPAVVRAAPVVPPAPLSAGAWSPAVNGLQGRLLVALAGKAGERRFPFIYLEIRNVSDIATPLSVKYDGDKSMTLEVADSKNRKAPPVGGVFSQVTDGPFNVVLPYTGTLRFLISDTGYGIAFNLPASSGSKPYFLRGTFSVLVSKKYEAQREWHGLLTLPPVKIPQ